LSARYASGARNFLRGLRRKFFATAVEEAQKLVAQNRRARRSGRRDAVDFLAVDKQNERRRRGDCETLEENVAAVFPLDALNRIIFPAHRVQESVRSIGVGVRFRRELQNDNSRRERIRVVLRRGKSRRASVSVVRLRVNRSRPNGARNRRRAQKNAADAGPSLSFRLSQRHLSHSFVVCSSNRRPPL
jgi:hypothetical protein